MTASSIAPASVRTGEPGDARIRVTSILVATMWFDVLYDAARSGRAHVPWAVALAGLVSQLAFTAAEAGVAVAGWRALGRRVRWSALAPRLLVASAAETLAVSIASGRALVPGGWALALAGPRAVQGVAPSSGLAAAFAATGVLAIVRMLFSAVLQARAARASLATAGALVVAMWLVSRLATWWTFDLLRGRSFQP
jgi:hypothetical protein